VRSSRESTEPECPSPPTTVSPITMIASTAATPITNWWKLIFERDIQVR
jgi:hypothetical protein